MEHPCHRCGAMLEEGKAFCPNCNAPQIRVVSPQEQSPSFPPGTPDHVQPPAQPVPLGEQSAGPVVVGPGRDGLAPAEINWSHALPTAIVVGVIFGLSWIFPPWSWCLLVMMAGVLAVSAYRLRFSSAPITGAMGAKIGAVSGVFSFLVFVVALAALLLASRASGRLRETLQQYVQQAAAQTPDAQAQQMIMKLASPEGIALLVTLSMVVAFVGFVVLSSIGGALGAALLGRSQVRH